MSFQQKNIAVSLGTFSLILGFFLLRLWQMTQAETFTSSHVFRLWGIVIVSAVVVTIAATILTYIVAAIIEFITTGNEDPQIDDLADERDQLIDLKGTKIAYILFSIGVFLAMLAFALGQPPLVMFTVLIFVGFVAQIVGDIWRLILYRRGF